MCVSLLEIKEAVAVYAKGFDAALLSASDASQVVTLTTDIESMISAVRGLAAARAAEALSWKNDGYRSAEEELAARTGTTPGKAKEMLNTGKRMAKQPEVTKAALDGQLTPTQATLVTEGVEADPSSADRLIGEAQTSGIGDLRDAVAKTKAAVTDLEARRKAIHKARSLRSFMDTDGVWHLRGEANPEDGKIIHSALAPIRNALFRKARQEQRLENDDAYMFDALLTLAQIATGHPSLISLEELQRLGLFPNVEPPSGDTQAAESSGVPSGRARRKKRRRFAVDAKILIRVDYDSLLRGAPIDGETCELVGFGPVATSVVEEYLSTANPFIVAVLTKAQDVVGIAHLGRQPLAVQQSALEWLYPSCAAEGCSRRLRLERDHRIDWAKTHYTMFGQLDLLCRHHHRLKTTANWGLVDGRGKRPFVPPDDARHPRHAAPAPQPGPAEARGAGPVPKGPMRL
jgi:hypothetical protein